MYYRNKPQLTSHFPFKENFVQNNNSKPNYFFWVTIILVILVVCAGLFSLYYNGFRKESNLYMKDRQKFGYNFY